MLWREDAQQSPTDAAEQALRGGILADEMGLGKSLEVMALILAHPPPGSSLPRVDQSPKTGPIGWDGPDRGPLPCNATLIVSPRSLLDQWIGELRRHSTLKVLHYQGLVAHAEAAAGQHGSLRKKGKREVSL